MENYLVVLLLSVFILLGAFYVNTAVQRTIQIKDEFLKHRNEIKKVREELESTRTALKEVKVELESTRKELKQVHVELESMRKELKQVYVELELTRKELKQLKVELESTRNALKQVKVELESTREQINLLRKEMIEKDKARREEIDQIRADENALREELNEIKKGMNHHDEEFSAFAASLTASKTLGVGELVKFDKVWTNVQKHYDPITGVYTAPKPGVYQFSCTVMTSSNGVLRVFLWKNNAKTVAVYPGQIGYNTGTLNMVLELNKGDKIYIKQGGSEEKSIYSESHSNFSLFSGFLIRSTTNK
ncbi:multimerin-2-like [Mytilus californianus]|uniref:multimerin-2-like n=1 Tax=Mytilus californianus TaxID=6549 RepID=UPI002245CBF4|nr:multimerin-2-like [Mytilus californianus]